MTIAELQFAARFIDMGRIPLTLDVEIIRHPARSGEWAVVEFDDLCNAHAKAWLRTDGAWDKTSEPKPEDWPEATAFDSPESALRAYIRATQGEAEDQG